MSVSRSTQSKTPETMACRRIVCRSVSVPPKRPPSFGRRSVATHGHFLYGVSRLKSMALARKSSRSSMNLVPRFTASWSSAATILWRVRPMTTSTRSNDMASPRDASRRIPDQITTMRQKEIGGHRPLNA